MRERNFLPPASPDAGIIPADPRRDRKETPQDGIGIFDENDPLKRVASWGPVGAEAVLAQVYPQDVSLFYDQMDVERARQEALDFQTVLRTHGVEVHSMRDVLAQGLSQNTLAYADGISKDQLISSLLGRVQGIYDAHYGPDGRSLSDGEYPAGGPKRVVDYEEPVVQLVDADIQRYGLQRAVALNTVLSLNPKMPLGNAIYARDQMNVILGTRFVASMARPIRQGEVPMYEALYRRLGLPPGVEMPPGETFEGGDAYIHNGIVYVGVGVRTTRGAAHHIYRTLEPQLKDLGFKFAIVEDVRQNTKTPDELQQFMHLDTFSNPTGPNEIVICDVESRNRRVKLVSSDSSGRILETDAGTFLDFLDERNFVTHVPPEAQAEFACNFLAIDDTTVLVADTGSPESRLAASEIERTGKTVIGVPLYESTRGFGATHCMSGQLARTH